MVWWRDRRRKNNNGAWHYGADPQSPGMVQEGEILFEGEDLLEAEQKEASEVRGKKIP